MKRAAKPCGRCGWIWPTFHICIDMSDPKVKQVVQAAPKPKATGKRGNGGGRTEKHTEESRQKMRDAHKARKDALKAANRSRDLAILKMYEDDGLNSREVGKEFGLSRHVVQVVLAEFEKEYGRKIIRPAARRGREVLSVQAAFN